MSRSYKKTPYAGQKKCKFSKRYSNKKIRKTEEQRKKIPNGGTFKKVMQTWDISDYGNVETWEVFKQRMKRHYSGYKNGIDYYMWRYYCQRFKMNPNSLDWKKLRWIWYKEYKNK